MCLLGKKSGLPRNDYWRRKDCNGPCETQSNQRLACINHSEGTTAIFGIWKLLPMIHPRIWKPDSPIEHPTKENQKIWMDPRMSKSLWHPERTIFGSTSTLHAWSDKTLYPWNGCLKACLLTRPDSPDKEPKLSDSGCIGSPENLCNSTNAIIAIWLEDREQPCVFQKQMLCPRWQGTWKECGA